MIYVEESKPTDKSGVKLFAGIAAALIIGVVGAGFLLLTTPTKSQDFYTSGDEETLYITGPVTAAIPWVLHQARDNSEPIPQRIVISSSGGNWLAALETIKFIREHNIDVIARDQCLSSCAYIWMSGERRGVVEGTQVLNHMPFMDPGGEIPPHLVNQVYWSFGLAGLDFTHAAMFVHLAKINGEQQKEFTSSGVPNGWVDLLRFYDMEDLEYTVFPPQKYDFSSVDSQTKKREKMLLKWFQQTVPERTTDK